MKNSNFEIGFNKEGCLNKLVIAGDKHDMNWVIDENYFNEFSYDNKDKLFGKFEIVVDGNRLTSHNAKKMSIIKDQLLYKVSYKFNGFDINFKYDLGKSENNKDMIFKITVKNRSDKILVLDEFKVWTAFSYVMFRDNNVLRNINSSCAVFPSISKDYTKIALFRRSNKGPHLGIYQLRGETKSVGTYCDYTNLFFDNVSPSLDGALYHQLVLAGGYYNCKGPEHDWIYNTNTLVLNPNSKKKWSYAICQIDSKDDFYDKGFKLSHPVVDYSPLALVGKSIEAYIVPPKSRSIDHIDVLNASRVETKAPISDGKVNKTNTSTYSDFSCEKCVHVSLPVKNAGEHKVNVVFSDGTQDSFVVNVMDKLPNILHDRVNYICDVLYQGANGENPYCFSPVSPQGESLGKLNLVLKTNLLSSNVNRSQIKKVEESAVHYISNKWFANGDFTKPVKLYGDFYRVMDFEYIGHTFYLLSQFSDDDLSLNSAATYMDWALQVFELRVNPDMHDNTRAKEETQMLGVFFLYVPDLLEDVKKTGNTEKYSKYKALWDSIVKRVGDGADTYKGAVTEHFFDNAGFGPSAGALAMNGHEIGASKYAELLLANIGFANDFRAQNPDRWWEALSYMIHSLWGGISAASMLKVYEWSHDYRHLEAAFRATVGILYCYDTNATSTNLKLKKGEAASTYSVAGPMLNLPKLSRNRFGQSVFAELGGIFARLFQNDDSTMDWDMGEELTAYLDGFGIKTFVYEKNGHVCVANGKSTKTDKGYVIESYAPFPREYHFYDKDMHFICDDDNAQGKVLLKDDGFVVL